MWFFYEKTLHLIWLGGGLSSLMASWFGLKSTRGNLTVSIKTYQSKTQSKTRGSEPAREDVGTFNINVPDPPLSRAGSAPTGDLCSDSDFVYDRKSVGAELAREDGGRSGITVADKPLSRASSASTGDLWCVSGFVYDRETCRSEPAREDGSPINTNPPESPPLHPTHVRQLMRDALMAINACRLAIRQRCRVHRRRAFALAGKVHELEVMAVPALA